MIGISDMFSMVGQDGCMDVASSLAMQGTDGCMSIPVYEIFFIKILLGDSAANVAGSIPEFNAIRQLSECCGAVSAQLNILDIDLLTLMGIMAVATPNTGMHVFAKLGDILVDELPAEVILQVAEQTGTPVPPGASNLIGFAQELLQMLFDRAIDQLADNLDSCGIELHQWNELPAYYNEVKASGEMEEMLYYRQQMGAAFF